MFFFTHVEDALGFCSLIGDLLFVNILAEYIKMLNVLYAFVLDLEISNGDLLNVTEQHKVEHECEKDV